MRQSRARMTRPWESPAYEPPPSFYRLPMTRTGERLKAILIAAGAALFGEGPAKGLQWPLMAEAFLGCLMAGNGWFLADMPGRWYLASITAPLALGVTLWAETRYQRMRRRLADLDADDWAADAGTTPRGVGPEVAVVLLAGFLLGSAAPGVLVDPLRFGGLLLAFLGAACAIARVKDARVSIEVWEGRSRHWLDEQLAAEERWRRYREVHPWRARARQAYAHVMVGIIMVLAVGLVLSMLVANTLREYGIGSRLAAWTIPITGPSVTYPTSRQVEACSAHRGGSAMFSSL
jgi:hypothetical protein